MARKLISSGSPFEAQFGYSRAVVQGNWCFVAGTTGRNPDTGDMPEDVCDQTENAFGIIETALTEGGFALSDTVRVTYYVTDMAFADVITPILGRKFGTIRPAATMVVVAGLIRPDMKVEIEVTAFRG
jgi:enamine deaminase RidA (YjgF/YER057c/UK114 family)